jgi:hypothetical protein
MKKLIILILLTDTILTFSQDWKSIKTNSINYYSTDSTFIHTVRIDSSIINGDTTVYYPFKMLRKDTYGLYRELGDNWIGCQINVLSNGFNIFYNHKHKSILLKTKAALNETWQCYAYSDSNFIEAKINSLGISNYLGQIDSVKTITFQLKDKYGNLIFNQSDSCKYINSSFLVLSKNYGLFKIIDFYKFPISTLDDLEDIYGSGYQYNLIGLTNPLIGYKKLSSRDFYDFNIGDEIHWSKYNWQSIYDYLYSHTSTIGWTKTEYIDKVISKEIALNDSSVVYKFDRIGKSYSSYNSEIEYTTSIASNEYYFYSIYWENPDIYEPLEPIGSVFFEFNTSFVKAHYLGESSYYDETWYNNAGYYYSHRYLGGHLLSNSYDDHYSLQYYTHGNYSWGTPYNFQFDQITNKTIDNTQLLKIYPNPVKDKLYIKKINTSNAQVIIYDLNGKQVLIKQITANFIDVSSLSKGFYILKLAESKSLSFNKFLKE